MAKDITHTIIQSVNNAYHVKTLHFAPANASDLLSLVISINHKHQLTVWFPKEVPIEMAQPMAEKFAEDMKKDLADS
jgi:hypothetical protein